MVNAQERVEGLLLPTKGLVTVDLCDADTGRVIQREQAENFLSLQSIKVAKWWQRMMWGAYNPVETGDAVAVKPTEMPWFPAQHLAYWNDATAESAGTEDRVGKDLVGWASRHPIGSPSGKRGVVNISESEFKDAYAKWVFDWQTSQGNGTFQSVGWTRVDEGIDLPIARFPEDDAVTFANLGGSETGGATPPPGGNAPLWWDATTGLWNTVEAVTAANQYRVVSVPAAGGATTQIALLPNSSFFPNGNPGVSPGSFLWGIARIGSDIINCGNGIATGPRLTRHTSAGVLTWSRTESAFPSRTYTDCTIDAASNIWTVSDNGVMRRHSNADGTITASVTPALGGMTALAGIAFDASDGNFFLLGTVGGIRAAWKADSSGNSVGPFFSLRQSPFSVTSTTPYVGTYNVPSGASREPYLLVFWQAATATGSTLARNPTRIVAIQIPAYASGLTMKSGDLWIGSRASAGGTAFASPLRGGTLGTRSLLASPITKTNSQTLKVTYQFNFS